MIEQMTYEELIKVSNELKQLIATLETIVPESGPQDIKDFISTVEGYSKYLETTVQINQDADIALKELVDKLH